MIAPPPGFLRPLGAFEEFFWLLDQVTPSHFLIAAQIKGQATTAEWRSALDALQQRHPMLSVCIDSLYNKVPYFRHAPRCPIPLRIVPEGSPWEREAERELATQFQSDQAPLMRVVLIPRPEGTFLLLVTHHAIADALSSTFMVRDLLAHLSGEKLQPYPLPRSLNRAIDQPQHISTQPGRSTSPNKTTAEPVHVQSLTLSLQLTDKLQQCTRQQGTTVQAALCAAVARAGGSIEPLWRTASLHMMSPVNARSFAGFDEEVVLATSACHLIFDPQNNSSLWHLASTANGTLTKAKTREGALETHEAITPAINAGMELEQMEEFARSAGAISAVVSNLGRISCRSDFGKFQLELLLGPMIPHSSQHTQVIGAATTNGFLSLTHVAHTPLPALLPAIEEQLRKACIA